MTIEIIISDDLGSVIGKRTTSNWEVAEMNLESLRKHWCENGFKKKRKFGNEIMSPKDEADFYIDESTLFPCKK